MSIDELREWQAFDSVNPIGDYRMDLNFALLAQKIITGSGRCTEVPSLKELLVIDPFPLTNEQRAIQLSEQDKARSEAYTEALISSLKRRVKRN